MSGDRTALELALAVAGDELEPELELFDEPLTEAGRAKWLDPEKRRPGRPAGARNKRTERTAAMLLATHGDPRIVQLRRALMPAADFAALYGCSLIDAVVEQRLIFAGVAPYLHQRMPIALDVTQREELHITINETPVLEDGELAGVVLENEDYQRVTIDEASAVGQSPVGQKEGSH